MLAGIVRPVRLESARAFSRTFNGLSTLSITRHQEAIPTGINPFSLQGISSRVSEAAWLHLSMSWRGWPCVTEISELIGLYSCAAPVFCRSDIIGGAGTQRDSAGKEGWN